MNLFSNFRLSLLGYLVVAGLCATVGFVAYNSFFTSDTSPIAVSDAAAEPAS